MSPFVLPIWESCNDVTFTPEGNVELFLQKCKKRLDNRYKREYDMGERRKTMTDQEIRELYSETGEVRPVAKALGIPWHRAYQMLISLGMIRTREISRPPEETVPAVRKAVRRRDNFICQLCGKKESPTGRRFHVHHFTRDLPKDMVENPENKVLLCESCHHLVHGPRRPQLTKMLKSIIAKQIEINED